MSISILNRIFEDATTTGSQRLVLLVLADVADDNGYCWPGVDWIAKRANITSRQARTILRALESAGHLITSPTNGGRGRTNQYIIATGEKPGSPASINPEVQREKPGSPASQNPEVQRSETRKFGDETRKPNVPNPEVTASDDPLYPPIDPPIDPPAVPAATTAAAAAIPTPSMRDRRSDPELGQICTAYENEIGLLTETIGDELKSLAEDYPANWIIESFAECARFNVRKLNYAKSILTRWKNEGKNTDGKPTANRSRNSRTQPATTSDPVAEAYNRLLGFTAPDEPESIDYNRVLGFNSA